MTHTSIHTKDKVDFLKFVVVKVVETLHSVLNFEMNILF